MSDQKTPEQKLKRDLIFAQMQSQKMMRRSHRTRRDMENMRLSLDKAKAALRYIEDQEPATQDMSPLHDVCQHARNVLKEIG